MSEGNRLGWKAGFGTKQAMAALGTTGPLAAPLTTATLLEDGGEQSIQGWARPLLEAEIAVRIGAGGGIAGIAPAIELVDVHGPQDDVDAILANGIYHRAVVLGEWAFARPHGLTVDVIVNGTFEVTAADALAQIGEPADVLAGMAANGAELRPGDVVITGATVPPVPIRPGDEVTVRINDLGDVSVRVT